MVAVSRERIKLERERVTWTAVTPLIIPILTIPYLLQFVIHLIHEQSLGHHITTRKTE